MAEEAQATQGDTTTAEATTASAQTTQEETAEATAPAPETTQEASEGTEATTEQAKPEAEEAKAEDSSAEKPDRGLLGETDDSGVPETYEDFKFPEGIDVGEDDQEQLKQMAKENKLSQEEAQKAVQFSRNVIEQIAKDEQKAVEEFKAANEKEWKSQPEYERMTLLAEKGVKTLGKELETYLGENGYLHDAKVLSILAKLGDLSSEATHVAGTDSPPQGAGKFYNQSPELYS